MAGPIRFVILAAALGTVIAACGHGASRHPGAAKPPPFAAAPPACFASKGCPGMNATICFAANGTRSASARCPTVRRQFRFAEPPPPRR